VLHPVGVVTLGEVLASMSSTRLLTLLSTVHSLNGVEEQVLCLQSLNEISVPDHGAICCLELTQHLISLINELNTLGEDGSSTENGSVVLHNLLHVSADLSSRDGSGGIANSIKARDRVLTSVGFQGLLGSTRLGGLSNVVSASATENNDIQQRVGTETVSTVDGHTGSLTSGVETRDDRVGVTIARGNNLTSVESRDTTHVVVNSGENGDWLLGDIDTSENGGSLRDTGETLGKNVRAQVVEIKKNVILVGTSTATLADLDGHRSGHNVTRGQLFGSGGIALHETLTLSVQKETTLTTGTLSDQATSSVDTSGVELNELQILERKTSAGNHSVTVTSASVSRGGREISTTITTSSKNGVLGTEAMDGTILHAVGNDTAANAILHDQINNEVLDEEDAVVAESLTVKSVQDGVTGTISGGGAADSLTTLTKIKGLSTESTLVDRTILVTREGNTVVLELDNGSGGLTAHIVDSILISEPIRTLNGIISVPAPVILGHVTERGIDTTLGSNSV
jgi:hypothetical protein